MKVIARRCLKALALAVVASPFVALALFLAWAGRMSVVMVAPSAYWMAAASFTAPMLTGWALWRLANLIR